MKITVIGRESGKELEIESSNLLMHKGSRPEGRLELLEEQVGEMMARQNKLIEKLLDKNKLTVEDLLEITDSKYYMAIPEKKDV